MRSKLLRQIGLTLSAGTGLSLGRTLAAFLVLSACGQETQPLSTGAESGGEGEQAHLVVDAAIAAHGGFEELKAASTWVADIRRFQRGDSYVLTNYYRPGMVRLEQDLGNGEKSADIIGDPHCWGMQGPLSIPCSPETRENDRPRVIMEIAAQLWPLKEEDWVLLGATSVVVQSDHLDIVTARYLPRDTEAEFAFDGVTHMLRSISVAGVKGGILGTHLHIFSDYQEYCGVKMPAHNEKSFEGETWVVEDVLELACTPVEEGLFIRPPQVAEGAFVESPDMLSIFSLQAYDEDSSTLAEKLRAEAIKRSLRPNGPVRRIQYDRDGMGPTGELVIELQLPVVGIDD